MCIRDRSCRRRPRRVTTSRAFDPDWSSVNQAPGAPCVTSPPADLPFHIALIEPNSFPLRAASSLFISLRKVPPETSGRAAIAFGGARKPPNRAFGIWAHGLMVQSFLRNKRKSYGTSPSWERPSCNPSGDLQRESFGRAHRSSELQYSDRKLRASKTAHAGFVQLTKVSLRKTRCGSVYGSAYV